MFTIDKQILLYLASERYRAQTYRLTNQPQEHFGPEIDYNTIQIQLYKFENYAFIACINIRISSTVVLSEAVTITTPIISGMVPPALQ